jgi:hypothetical protein
MRARVCGRHGIAHLAVDLVRRYCLVCKHYLPRPDGTLPPANDTPDAMMGIMAATASEEEPPHGRYRLAISMYMCLRGWPTLERATVEDRGEWVDECEQLAFAIREHA